MLTIGAVSSEPAPYAYSSTAVAIDPSGVDWRVQHLCETVQQRFGSPALSLVVFSRDYGISANHLGRLFKRVVGTSFRHYLLELRIKNACELLQSTQYPLKRIAYAVGYDSPSNFSQDFKFLIGISPGAFRHYRSPAKHVLTKKGGF